MKIQETYAFWAMIQTCCEGMIIIYIAFTE